MVLLMDVHTNVSYEPEGEGCQKASQLSVPLTRLDCRCNLYRLMQPIH